MGNGLDAQSVQEHELLLPRRHSLQRIDQPAGRPDPAILHAVDEVTLVTLPDVAGNLSSPDSSTARATQGEPLSLAPPPLPRRRLPHLVRRPQSAPDIATLTS